MSRALAVAAVTTLMVNPEPCTHFATARSKDVVSRLTLEGAWFTEKDQTDKQGSQSDGKR